MGGHLRRLQPLVDSLRAILLDSRRYKRTKHRWQCRPSARGKYMWAYSSIPLSELKAKVYDFAQGRAGEHARALRRGAGTASWCVTICLLQGRLW
tara:strand:+ start:1168 stop:1452 length:285 start_codon:yes stop_codon:yes gene_type:complete